MSSEKTQPMRVIDKVTKQTYRIVRMGNRTVLLESDDSVQILTSISALNAYYEFLQATHTQSPLRWAKDRVKG